jgi:hypothetical protein
MNWAFAMVGALIGAVVDALLRAETALPNAPQRLRAVKLLMSPERIYPPNRIDLLDLVADRVSLAGEPDGVYQSQADNPELYYLHVPAYYNETGFVGESWWAVSAQELLG